MRRRMNSTDIHSQRREDRGERREERGGRTRCAVAIALKASSIRLFDDCFHTYGSPPDFACKPEQTPPVRHHAIAAWFGFGANEPKRAFQSASLGQKPLPQTRLAPAWHGIALPDLDIVTWSLHVAAAVADLIGAGVSRERRIDPRSREVDGLQSQTRVACASHCARRREPRASLAPNANA